jgi:hypothetical protein
LSSTRSRTSASVALETACCMGRCSAIIDSRP